MEEEQEGRRRKEEGGTVGALVGEETRLCVNMYIKCVCVWRPNGTEAQKEEENPLQRQFRDGDWGSVMAGWTYRERNGLENEAVVQSRSLFIPSEVAEK